VVFEFIIGVLTGLAIVGFARFTQFDQDRSFYATVLIVITSYYILFAFMGGEGIDPLDVVVALILSAAALLGVYMKWPMLIAYSILAHGILDFFHHHIIDNAGVPSWWPGFCGGVDVAIFVVLVYLFKSKKIQYNYS